MLELNYARRAERRAVDLSCDVVAHGWDEALRHRVTDMSPYGLWVRTSFPLKVGAQVAVSFRPPSAEEELTVFAEVARAERTHVGERGRSGMGLEFIDLTGAERRALQACLSGLPAPTAWKQHVLRWQSPIYE